MSDTYLVQLSHPLMGNSLLGILSAESTQAAQARLLELLKENGMPEENISYDVSTYNTITLKGDVMLKIYRAMTVEQWVHILPFLIAYER
ncbi:MAG: hypothetical protein JWL75_710 [Parcubacteria group bacterium]|nr:hypothetical protein [Parcubacteria group bacterium]